MNVSDIFRANATTRPDAVAWIDEQRPGVTYADLDAIIDAVAQRLLDAGVRAGQRVTTALDNGLPMLAVMMAVARIGAESIDRLAADDRCDACTASPGREPSSVAPTLRVTDEWFARVVDARGAGRDARRRPGGLPAFAHLGHHRTAESGRVLARPVHRARRVAGACRPLPVRRCACCRWSGSTPTTACRSRCARSPMAARIVGGTAIEALADAIARHRVNALVVSPAMLAQLVAQPCRSTRGPIPSLAYVEVSGGRLTGRLARLALARLSPHLHVLYGSTECGIVTHSPWQETAGRPGAAGRLVPGGVEVAVVDANGASLPRGSEGRLRFRGATCARGYADDSGSDDRVPRRLVRVRRPGSHRCRRHAGDRRPGRRAHQHRRREDRARAPRGLGPRDAAASPTSPRSRSRPPPASTGSASRS